MLLDCVCGSLLNTYPILAVYRGVSRKLSRGVLNYRRASARAIFWGHAPLFRDHALYFTRGWLQCQVQEAKLPS